MCNECGHSRFGKFELSLSASPCVSYPPILNQDDMLRALGCLEHNVSAAQTRRTGLSNATRYVCMSWSIIVPMQLCVNKGIWLGHGTGMMHHLCVLLLHDHLRSACVLVPVSRTTSSDAWSRYFSYGFKCSVLTGSITAKVPHEAMNLSFTLCSLSAMSIDFPCKTCLLTSQCRSLMNAMSSWAGRVRTGPSPSPSSSSAGAPATAKGVNTAVAAVAAAYNDKCKPAHDIAVQASQALNGVRSALTTYLREGDNRAQVSLPDLASLGCAELKAAGNSYRSASADT